MPFSGRIDAPCKDGRDQLAIAPLPTPHWNPR
jgi:hypothetical protein